MHEEQEEKVTCRQIIELLTAHAGTIPEAESQEARSHLEVCPSCTEWERTLKAAIEVFGTAANVEVPEPFRHRMEEISSKWEHGYDLEERLRKAP
ncbi:MAG: hypothetical protein HYY20_08580 [Candidatus Tectomicrobia bacterium]|uniref:Putative zinc-finger domain-containing protein n=1 Tax=Tectimicrobiota bacterium TaxID=2528274 RepID=A0A932CP72_UNCTE|nr:hypothetical protein [Candidatus Tectomicrobia bacterium]